MQLYISIILNVYNDVNILIVSKTLKKLNILKHKHFNLSLIKRQVKKQHFGNKIKMR